MPMAMASRRSTTSEIAQGDWEISGSMKAMTSIKRSLSILSCGPRWFPGQRFLQSTIARSSRPGNTAQSRVGPSNVVDSKRPSDSSVREHVG